MEIKEAIDILKSCRKDAEYVDSEYVDSLEINVISIAISALEKQEGKKPKDGKYVGRCECGGYVYSDQRFCPNCGQKLDWSDVEVREDG